MKTKVRFKSERFEGLDGSVEYRPLAVFTETASGGFVDVYATAGQHQRAELAYVEGLRDASPSEVSCLENELRSIGYEVDARRPGERAWRFPA